MTTTASLVSAWMAFDEGGDVFRGAAAMFRQFANFVGNDRETATRFTGARCFDGGVSMPASWSVR